MTQGPQRVHTPASISDVRIGDGFWGRWRTVVRETTIPYLFDMCDGTGRTAAMKLEWSSEDSWRPHPFYDSDVAKSLEAAAYALIDSWDDDLAKRLDGYVQIVAKAQQPDGYLNSYYTITAPDQRWTNLRDMHELYCAGHLFEAAVAHHEATGERSFLDVVCRLADHIDSRFGPSDSPSPEGGTKTPGYPGHEEIELALVKLYRATGERRYLDLARFFVDERGRVPSFFGEEAARRGEHADRHTRDYAGPYAYYQAHLPVREQTTAEGHSVRACYLYAGMVDVAAETGDEGLLDATRKLFWNIVDRRMYVTGGIGSTSAGERFTFDYDLPNEEAYAETCASIALIFFANRLLNAEIDGSYGDVVERALYNGALGGLALSGKRFLYANPLTVHPTASMRPESHFSGERTEWFECSCCPPNIARLIASLGSYAYSVSAEGVAVNLYLDSALSFEIHGAKAILRQSTDYPWDGEVRLSVECDEPITFDLALRIPAWAEGYTIEGASVSEVRRGYAYITKTWSSGDEVIVSLPMDVRRVYANPAVRQAAGLVAIERGPIVYCWEEADNGGDLATLALPDTAELDDEFRGELLGGCVAIDAVGVQIGSAADGGKGVTGEALYRGTRKIRKVPLRAIPFALRLNREPGEMRVWLHER